MLLLVGSAYIERIFLQFISKHNYSFMTFESYAFVYILIHISYHRVLVLCSSFYGRAYMYDVSSNRERKSRKNVKEDLRIITSEYIYFYFESIVCMNEWYIIVREIESSFDSCIFFCFKLHNAQSARYVRFSLFCCVFLFFF